MNQSDIEEADRIEKYNRDYRYKERIRIDKLSNVRLYEEFLDKVVESGSDYGLSYTAHMTFKLLELEIETRLKDWLSK